MSALGQSRRGRPKLPVDPLPPCSESGLKVGALASDAMGQQPTSAFLLPVDHCCSDSRRILLSASPEGASQFSDILQFFKAIDE
jgi:hypothetical protein